MIHPITLDEHARTLHIDGADVDTPETLPEPTGTRDGQPTYDPDALDHAYGVTTIGGYARLRGLDHMQVRRWVNRHPGLWPEPVGRVVSRTTGPGAALYPLGAVDAVHDAEKARAGGGGVEGVTMDEYAERIGVSPATVKNRWRVKFKDIWPDPVVGEDGRTAKRGRAVLFPVEGLERVRRAARGLPEPVGDPGDLLTRGQVMEYLGLSEDQQWWREYRGLWPAGVVDEDGVERWVRGEVEELHSGLVARRGGQPQG